MREQVFLVPADPGNFVSLALGPDDFSALDTSSVILTVVSRK